MIPAFIVVGVAAGVVLYRRPRALSITVAVTALVWALVITLDGDASLTAAPAALFATSANLAVGAFVGRGLASGAFG